jgi:hypothetical protein
LLVDPREERGLVDQHAAPNTSYDLFEAIGVGEKDQVPETSGAGPCVVVFPLRHWDKASLQVSCHMRLQVNSGAGCLAIEAQACQGKKSTAPSNFTEGKRTAGSDA